MKVEEACVKRYTVFLSEEEYRLLYFAIGNTNHVSRTGAGMTNDQSEFLHELFMALPEPQGK